MPDHAAWVAKGFCDAIYIDDEDGEHWCRLWIEHEGKHVAPWRYEFPRQESMVRWDDGPTNVGWAVWVNQPVSAA